MTLWRLYPDNFPFRRDPTVGAIERKVQRSAGRQNVEQPQQESPPAHISYPPLERIGCRILRLTGDEEIQWQADPGPSLLPVGEKQVPKGLELVWGEMSESDTVEDPSIPLAVPSVSDFPDHLGLDLDSAAVHLEVDVEETGNG